MLSAKTVTLVALLGLGLALLVAAQPAHHKGKGKTTTAGRRPPGKTTPGRHASAATAHPSARPEAEQETAATDAPVPVPAEATSDSASAVPIAAGGDGGVSTEAILATAIVAGGETAASVAADDTSAAPPTSA